MARITLRQLLDHAADEGYGVPAFNINNMEQALAVMEAMKMELTLSASRAGVVESVLVSEGEQVSAGAVLVMLQQENPA